MSLSTASAAECPAVSTEAVVSTLRNARSCRVAAQTYRACTRATTQDVEFAEVVVGKCESGFIARLKPKQRAPKNYLFKCRPRIASDWTRRTGGPSGCCWRLRSCSPSWSPRWRSGSSTWEPLADGRGGWGGRTFGPNASVLLVVGAVPLRFAPPVVLPGEQARREETADYKREPKKAEYQKDIQWGRPPMYQSRDQRAGCARQSRIPGPASARRAYSAAPAPPLERRSRPLAVRAVVLHPTAGSTIETTWPLRRER
jgi:hypothetical protein